MKKILTILLGFSTCFIEAQTINGRVLDASTGQPIAGAIVVWFNTNIGIATDVNGAFKMPIPDNPKSLIFSFVGYETDTVAFSNQPYIKHVMRSSVTGPMVNIVGDKPATHLTMLNPQNFQTMGIKELCKAACCNLSESFETNASIDASFADAITGTKQIRMLGLDGKYTQIMFDNIPAVRGLATTYGLTYVPGPFINSIQIAKGAGSVIAGYESITGQINVSHKNPDNAEPLHINAYAGSGGRLEMNIVWNPSPEHDHEEHEELEDHDHEEHEHVHKHTYFKPVLLVHGAMSNLRWDMNGDGFLDNPLFQNLIVRNEWHLETDYGLGGQYAVSYTHLNNMSGQLDYSPSDAIRSQLWGANLTTNRYDFSAKTGYVFPEKSWKSFGSQVSASWHDQQGNYGFRLYSGQQTSARVNLLFASRIKNDSNKFTTGISYLYDDYRERLFFDKIPPVALSSFNLNRLETAPGAFFEYTYSFMEKLIVVAGIRGDLHNTYGILITPRLHSRYSFNENTSLKVSVGKGYRTANILMDHVGVLASNREIVLKGNNASGLFGMDMEQAWNSGIIFTRKLKLNHREASVSIDAYRTNFTNQVVMDLETPTVVSFYNLSGKSYSNSAQIETQWSPFKRWDWRLAYRWLEVRTDYTSGLLDKPLLNRHRAFTNIAYETKEGKNGRQWRFDATFQWISRKRIPPTMGHHESTGVSTYSDDYVQLNAQVTYVFRKNVELYIGGENLTNFMVHDPILSAENPNSERFDGSLIWGPVFGRMGYVGFRWTLP